MAAEKGNTNTTEAEYMAASEAAQKSGAAWAQRFVQLARSTPEDYELQGWIGDAERLFKDKPYELAAFYGVLQAALLEHERHERNPIMKLSAFDVAHGKLGSARAIIDTLAMLDMGGQTDSLTKGSLTTCLLHAEELLSDALEMFLDAQAQPVEVHHG